jgi:hypothetical protein
MADEPKQPWYKSAPGILTAATGFIAALSGLVAGLNQLGAFRREPPASTVVGTAPAPADHTAQDTDSVTVRETPPPDAALRPAAPSPAPPSAAPPKPAPTASPSPPPTGSQASDTTSGTSITVPQGTAISVAVPSRTCAPADGSKRVTARVSDPVQVRGVTVIPAGTTAVLHLRRAGRPAVLRVRLDSLVPSGRALPIASSQVQIPRAAASGVCLRAGAQLNVVLGEAIMVPRS